MCGDEYDGSGVVYMLVCALVAIPAVGRGVSVSFLFQAEDGIRYLVRSRGLGDVYKRQERARCAIELVRCPRRRVEPRTVVEVICRNLPDQILSLIHI